MATVDGKVYWTCVNHLNTEYDEWSVKVVPDGKKVHAAMKKSGLSESVISNEDDTKCFKFKRNSTRKDGTANSQPPCFIKDEDGKAMPFTGMIGNGSTARVQYSTYDWKYKGKSGVSGDFKGIYILDLISYGGKDGDELFGDDEGHLAVPDKEEVMDDDVPF